MLPKCNGLYFEIEYIYLEELIEKQDLDEDRYLSIDWGWDNFVTCVTTKWDFLRFEGKGIKSYNRWWNKESYGLFYDKQNIKKGRKLCYLFKNRENMINEYKKDSTLQ